MFFCRWQDEDSRPEPVEIIVQAFQALVEDGHILGVLGLTESAFEGGNDKRRCIIDLNRRIDASCMLTVT